MASDHLELRINFVTVLPDFNISDKSTWKLDRFMFTVDVSWTFAEFTARFKEYIKEAAKKQDFSNVSDWSWLLRSRKQDSPKVSNWSFLLRSEELRSEKMQPTTILREVVGEELTPVLWAVDKAHTKEGAAVIERRELAQSRAAIERPEVIKGANTPLTTDTKNLLFLIYSVNLRTAKHQAKWQRMELGVNVDASATIGDLEQKVLGAVHGLGRPGKDWWLEWGLEKMSTTTELSAIGLSVLPTSDSAS